jgi:Ca2+-transporting ATPase
MRGYFYDNIEDVIKSLRGNKTEGLSLEDARKRLEKDGPNKINRAKNNSYVFRFLVQFTDLLAVILIVASLLSLMLGSVKDAVIIFLIVLTNSTIGFIQEYKAEKAIEALKKYMPENTTVIRGNDLKTIPTKELVAGDLVVLNEGTKVPADIRLFESLELLVNEAAITGESESQTKGFMETEEHKNISDLAGSVLMGTTITHGEGKGIVVATGMDTQLGRIAKVTSDQKESKSPLQIEIDHIAKVVAKASLFVVLVLVTVYSILHGRFAPKESLEFAIGVASALVPEGLPATVSIALAVGIQRMARRRAVIRRLSAVETLGEAGIIVTDKTGTLTKNEMTVKEIYFEGKTYHLKGVGYGLSGEITENGHLLSKEEIKKLEPLMIPAVIANDAEVDTVNHSRPDFVGDSTELALLVAAEKLGVDTYDLKHSTKVIEEIPFEAERKYMAKMAVLNGKEMVFLKGAPNVVIGMCTRILKNGKVQKITPKDRHDINFVNDSFSKEALRVMAIAYKQKDGKKLEDNLIFAGLMGIIDPPREEVAETIRIAKNAGVRAIMVTGDYGFTAAAIAKRIKLNNEPKIYTGEDLNDISDHDLAEILKSEDIIFSRVDPIHKLRIVKILQQIGYVVAVTGDGVNDAPALKKSDIGVAMGLTGTDVAKEAAEMVSTNDSFASIVWAIKEGRVVYENIKKVTRFVFTSNIAEFVAVCLGLLIGISPIFAIQILLVDLGAEVFPALALAADGEEDDVMSSKPRAKNDILFGKETILYILRSGGVMGVLATLAFFVYLKMAGASLDSLSSHETIYLTATTVTYATIAVCQYVNSISIRSATLPFHKLIFGNKRLLGFLLVSVIFINSIIYIPFLQSFAYMRPLGISEWGIVLAFGFIYLLILELLKKLNPSPNRLTKVLTNDIAGSAI